MAQIDQPSWNIRRVRAVRPCDEGLQVDFVTGRLPGEEGIHFVESG